MRRRDVDPFAGVTDPVEMLKIVHQPPRHSPFERVLGPPRPVEELYAGLTQAQIVSLAAYTADRALAGDLEQAEPLARCLASFTEGDLDPVMEAFVSQGNFYPGVLFRRAGSRIRDGLIRRLGQDAPNRDHLLTALAWIGDGPVVELFSRWKERPPSWAGQLHVPPEDYAQQAGWELSAQGERRDLFHLLCYGLIPRRPGVASALAVAVPDNEPCGRCGRPMTALVDLDLTTARLGWIPMGEGALRLRTCQACAAYHGAVYTWLTGEGPFWHPGNPPEQGKARGEWLDLPADRLTLAPEPRSPFHAADLLLPTRFSQLGGHPTWVQDAAFPFCPDCSRRMVFLAQVDCADLDAGEGLHYAFVCYECRVGATAYQQT